MLKRQRPSSPVPQLLAETAPEPAWPLGRGVLDDPLQRHAKRPRTCASILDGQLRGWNDVVSDDEDDNEDRYPHAGPSRLPFHPTKSVLAADHHMEGAWEYRRTNGLLHSLHIQQQQLKSRGQVQGAQAEGSSYRPLFTPSNHNASEASSSNVPSDVDRVKNVLLPVRKASPIEVDEAESQSVRDRYENTNKYALHPCFFLVFVSNCCYLDCFAPLS
jgi:hypothetical protein